MTNSKQKVSTMKRSLHSWCLSCWPMCAPTLNLTWTKENWPWEYLEISKRMTSSKRRKCQMRLHLYNQWWFPWLKCAPTLQQVRTQDEKNLDRNQISMKNDIFRANRSTQLNETCRTDAYNPHPSAHRHSSYDKRKIRSNVIKQWSLWTSQSFQLIKTQQ